MTTTRFSKIQWGDGLTVTPDTDDPNVIRVDGTGGTGPAGPTGPTGPTGPAGPAVATSYALYTYPSTGSVSVSTSLQFVKPVFGSPTFSPWTRISDVDGIFDPTHFAMIADGIYQVTASAGLVTDTTFGTHPIMDLDLFPTGISGVESRTTNPIGIAGSNIYGNSSVSWGGHVAATDPFELTLNNYDSIAHHFGLTLSILKLG